MAWQLQCAKTSVTGAQTMPGGHFFSSSACHEDIPLNFLSCIFPHCLHNGRDGWLYLQCLVTPQFELVKQGILAISRGILAISLLLLLLMF